MIGGDAPDRVVREERGIRITGASDITKLLLPTDRYHRLHVTRNKLRQSRRPKLAQYTHLLNRITDAEENSRSLDAMQKLLRGVPGNYSRLSSEAYWRRSIIDSYGQVFTPFVIMRGDLAMLRVDGEPGVANYINVGENTV